MSRALTGGDRRTGPMAGASDLEVRMPRAANGIELSDEEVVIVETEYEQRPGPVRYR